jgi:hypothetical protein
MSPVEGRAKKRNIHSKDFGQVLRTGFITRSVMTTFLRLRQAALSVYGADLNNRVIEEAVRQVPQKVLYALASGPAGMRYSGWSAA